MMTARRHRARALGLTLIEIMVALAVLTMMLTSVWSSFRGTLRGLESSEEIQKRYAIVRSGLSRMTAELSMAYLSFNRPPGETRHFTMFEGRDSGDQDSVTFSSFAHLRIRRDANESDQTVIQYFLADDPEDSTRQHLYRREARRLTGDLPERMEDYFPAYVMIEDVDAFDLKYWDGRQQEWLDEWATMRVDMQPDRLPQRVKITLKIKDMGDDGEPLEFTAQTILFLQEKIDLSK